MALKVGIIICSGLLVCRIVWMCAVLWCTSANIDALLCGYAIMIAQENNEEEKKRYREIFTHLYRIRKLLRGRKKEK